MQPLKKLIFLIGEDRGFLSHRLSLACAARDSGYDVRVITRVRDLRSTIEALGFSVIPLQSFDRGRMGGAGDLRAIRDLIGILRTERPDVLHAIGLKPALVGLIAAHFTRIPRVVSTFAGMGFLFTHGGILLKIIQQIVILAFRLLMQKSSTALIVQNPDDATLARTHHLIAPDRLLLIKGSGVDVDHFSPTPLPPISNQGPRIVFAARMLRDKGVHELIEAIHHLRARNVKAHFLFCGDCDTSNPTSLDEAQLKTWEAEGLIEWLGVCTDMKSVYQSAHIVVLPSYREGLPRTLLEAAACGRSIVTTDVPGCREIVDDKVTGLLVPAQDAGALATALECLIQDPELCAKMGLAGRRKVVDGYSDAIVNQSTLRVYSL